MSDITKDNFESITLKMIQSTSNREYLDSLVFVVPLELKGQVPNLIHNIEVKHFAMPIYRAYLILRSDYDNLFDNG